MSNNKEQIPQRTPGAALRSFFDHVMSYDEEGVRAALCMVANAAPQDPNAPTEIDGVPVVGVNICNFGAGDPDAMAQMMAIAIDTMLEEVPGFEKAWADALRAKRVQISFEQMAGLMKQAEEQATEAEGMEAVKPEVDALIEKLKGNPGAVPGPDTKQ